MGGREWQTCKRKRRFDTLEAANKALIQAWSDNGATAETDDGHAYSCQFCGGYHFGRPKRLHGERRTEYAARVLVVRPNKKAPDPAG